MSNMVGWFRGLSRKGKILAIIGASFIGMTTLAAAVPQPHVNTPPAVVASTKATPTPLVEKKKIEQKSAVAFQTVEQDDSSLARGTSEITQEGVDGERTVTFEVTLRDGKETGRTQISDEVTKQPVNKLVSNGTYVAPAPVPDNSGATAKCRDGTPSYSQHRSGTCSHHGGVATWY